MERKIDRELTLSNDEVQMAIYYWLKDVKDIPVPDKAGDLVIKTYGQFVSEINVSWRTEDEIK